MVLMKAAISEAATNPNKPVGRSVSIAGYAISWPNLSFGRSGNAFCRSESSGNMTNEERAMMIHGQGLKA